MASLIRSAAREFLPPIVTRYFRSIQRSSEVPTRISFEGVYPNWRQASAAATGYSDDAILKRVDAATALVVSDQATYERDGVTFQGAAPPLPLLAGLLRAAAESGGRLRVLDFGGSLGSSYRQCRRFLEVLDVVHWQVVEQPAFVARGRDAYETPELQFFNSAEEAARQGIPQVVLISGSLQYLERPHQLLRDLCALGSSYLIIDRTPLCNFAADRLTVQHIPPTLYSGSYPCWLFSRALMLASLATDWETLAAFPALDGVFDAQGTQIEFGGMILRRRTDSLQR